MVILPPVALRPAVFHGGGQFRCDVGCRGLLLERHASIVRWRAARQRDNQWQASQRAFAQSQVHEIGQMIK